MAAPPRPLLATSTATTPLHVGFKLPCLCLEAHRITDELVTVLANFSMTLCL